MKINKILFASIAAIATAFPSFALAGDVVNPFYGPEPGHILTKTSFNYADKKLDDGNTIRQKILKETVYYGINDAWSLYFDASNSWTKINGGDSYEVRDWDAGIGYYFEPTDNTSVDAELYYTEKKEEHSDIYKTLYFYGRFDFMKNNDIKPFIGLEYSRGLHQITKSDDWTTGFAGVWTRIDKIMLRGDIRAEYFPDYPEFTNTYAYLEAGYQINDSFAMTAYGKYTFYNHAEGANPEYSKNTYCGIMAKYLF